MPDDVPEPGIELTGVPVPLSAPEGSDPPGDRGLVNAWAPPLPAAVALELQADGVTAGVVVLWDGVVVLWQTGRVEPASAEVPAV